MEGLRPHLRRRVGACPQASDTHPFGTGRKLTAAYPAHFRVMFSPTLLDTTNADLVAAKPAAFDELRGGGEAMAARGQVEDAAAAVIAGWGIVHGIATLALTGNLDDAKLRSLVADGDLITITRRAASMLHGSPGSSAGPP